MILGSKHVGAILNVLMWNLCKCVSWCDKVILQNARCNNKYKKIWLRKTKKILLLISS